MKTLKNVLTTMVAKVKETKEKAVAFVMKKKWQTAMMLYGVLAPINVAYGADAKWNAMISFILPWIQRLGGVVLLIGAVEFGLAFKNDDAEGKTKGMRTAIAGCIVIAVGLSSSTFLMP